MELNRDIISYGPIMAGNGGFRGTHGRGSARRPVLARTEANSIWAVPP